MENKKYIICTDVGFIPENIKERLSKLSLDEQAKLFSLEKCRELTYWIDHRKLNTLKLPYYHGEEIAFIEKYPLLVQDGCIVGIYLSDMNEKLLWHNHPCSSVISFDGHRTDAEFGYEETHEWYIFRYLNIIRIKEKAKDFLTEAQYERLKDLTLEQQKKHFVLRWEHEQRDIRTGEIYGYSPAGKDYDIEESMTINRCFLVADNCIVGIYDKCNGLFCKVKEANVYVNGERRYIMEHERTINSWYKDNGVRYADSRNVLETESIQVIWRD